jgi:Ca-activated chloride channel family protein
MPEFGFDDWIDAQLRNVPLPPNLLARLAEAGPGKGAEDAQVETALRDVAVPLDLESRLRRIARPRRSRSVWRQVALAASLLIAVGLGGIGYLGFMSGALGPGRDLAHSDSSAAPAQPGPPAAATAVAQSDRSAGDSPVPRDVPPGESDAAAESLVESVPLAPAAPDAEPTDRAIVDVKLPEHLALGADGGLGRLPDLDIFAASDIGGVRPPLVRGYDLLFQLRQGEHPFVSPSAHASLAISRLPFSFATASYDRALTAVAAGRLPEPGEIRVEDFLAAQDFALPPAVQAGLALHVAGSQSPFEIPEAAAAAAPRRGEKLHLLQLAVQSASYDAHQHHPNRLIVALDTSAQMRLRVRFAAVQRALAKLAGHMAEGDRVTLLGFAEQPSVLVENATASELARLAARDMMSALVGATNVQAGIDAAAALALASSSREPRQVVVITGDRGSLDAALASKSTARLTELAERNIPWHVIRVAAGEDEAYWNELADKGRGKVVAADAPDAIYHALFEALTAWPTEMADDVAVTVTFNPQQVAAYRLLGHEALTLTSPTSTPLSIDLGPDQVATGLYEVLIKPGEGELIASVEVAWRHPPTGQVLRIVRPVERGQLVGTFAAAPEWFQHGVVAAKAAESLRGSHYASSTRPVRQVLELAGTVSPGLASRADFARLVELLQQADKLR